MLKYVYFVVFVIRSLKREEYLCWLSWKYFRADYLDIVHRLNHLEQKADVTSELRYMETVIYKDLYLCWWCFFTTEKSLRRLMNREFVSPVCAENSKVCEA